MTGPGQMTSQTTPFAPEVDAGVGIGAVEGNPTPSSANMRGARARKRFRRGGFRSEHKSRPTHKADRPGGYGYGYDNVRGKCHRRRANGEGTAGGVHGRCKPLQRVQDVRGRGPLGQQVHVLRPAGRWRRPFSAVIALLRGCRETQVPNAAAHKGGARLACAAAAAAASRSGEWSSAQGATAHRPACCRRTCNELCRLSRCGLVPLRSAIRANIEHEAIRRGAQSPAGAAEGGGQGNSNC